MKTQQNTSRNSAQNLNHQLASNVQTEMLIEFVSAKHAGTRIISP